MNLLSPPRSIKRAKNMLTQREIYRAFKDGIDACNKGLSLGDIPSKYRTDSRRNFKLLDSWSTGFRLREQARMSVR